MPHVTQGRGHPTKVTRPGADGDGELHDVALLTVQDAEVRFGGVVALSDLSFRSTKVTSAR